MMDMDIAPSPKFQRFTTANMDQILDEEQF